MRFRVVVTSLGGSSRNIHNKIPERVFRGDTSDFRCACDKFSGLHGGRMQAIGKNTIRLYLSYEGCVLTRGSEFRNRFSQVLNLLGKENVGRKRWVEVCRVNRE